MGNQRAEPQTPTRAVKSRFRSPSLFSFITTKPHGSHHHRYCRPEVHTIFSCVSADSYLQGAFVATVVVFSLHHLAGRLLSVRMGLRLRGQCMTWRHHAYAAVDHHCGLVRYGCNDLILTMCSLFIDLCSLHRSRSAWHVHTLRLLSPQILRSINGPGSLRLVIQT